MGPECGTERDRVVGVEAGKTIRTRDSGLGIRRGTRNHRRSMRYKRMPIEVESPEEMGYASIRCNLAESSMRDRVLGDRGLDVDLGKTILLYGDHRGHPALRELLAAESGCAASQVLLTPGAAGALFIVSTSILSAGDHLVVLRPHYATNIETPRAIGCDISFVELSLENGFRYTAADIA